MRDHNWLKHLLNESSLILCETLAKCDELYSPSRNSILYRQQVVLFNECILFAPEAKTNCQPRIDTLLLCTHEGGMCNYDTFTVGVEIKESAKDMYRDPLQLKNYSNYTDYLFLGVPQNLIAAACERVKDNPYCGVFDIKTGQIYKIAYRQPLNMENRLRLMNTLVFRMKDNFKIFYSNTDRMFGTRALSPTIRCFNNEEYIKDAEALVNIRDERLKKYLYPERQIHYYTLSRKVFLTEGWNFLQKYSDLDIEIQWINQQKC